MNGVTQRELSFLLLLWGLSDPSIAELRKMPQSFSIKLHKKVSGRLGMSGGISPRHAQNPLPGERRKTLSITHHALSPPTLTSSSVHHSSYQLTIQRFYRIIMSLKRPFVSKSDVKQWFTTTTISMGAAFGVVRPCTSPDCREYLCPCMYGISWHRHISVRHQLYISIISFPCSCLSIAVSWVPTLHNLGWPSLYLK